MYICPLFIMLLNLCWVVVTVIIDLLTFHESRAIVDNKSSVRHVDGCYYWKGEERVRDGNVVESES